jgi:hypothetical protein
MAPLPGASEQGCFSFAVTLAAIIEIQADTMPAGGTGKTVAFPDLQTYYLPT